MIKRKCSLFYVLSVLCDISLYSQHGIIVCFYVCGVLLLPLLYCCYVEYIYMTLLTRKGGGDMF